MRNHKMIFILAGLMVFVLGIYTPNAYAADKTLSVKVIVNPDFWNSKITFPNGNKAEVNGIGVVIFAKGLPQIFKNITPGQNELAFNYTGVEDEDYQIKVPFLAGSGAVVYQTVEKIKNNGQTLTYTIGVDTSLRPLTIDLTQQ